MDIEQAVLMTIEFRIILAVIFFTFIIHRGYYSRKHKPVEGESLYVRDSEQSSILVTLLSVLGLVSLLLVFFAPRFIDWAAVPIPIWVRWLGVGLAAVGFSLLQWSQITLGKNWSDNPRIMKNQQLVTEGPYRRIRHPIYTAFLLILGSPLLITGNLILGLSWLGMTAIDIKGRVAFEEAALVDHFGEAYQDYQRRSGALLPWL